MSLRSCSSAKARGDESNAGFDWFPEGEFSFRLRNSSDRIFRIRDFEGRRFVGDERTGHDGDPGCGGLDLLGKYTLRDSTVTIYVDSCQRVELEYGNESWKLENLIEIVLIHELAHLITHQGFELEKPKGEQIDHLWEYTAQCAAYAYLREYGDEKALKDFEQLSPRQPFIYQTWEGVKAVESVQSQWPYHIQSTKRTVDVVKKIFSAIKRPVPEIDDLGKGIPYDD